MRARLPAPIRAAVALACWGTAATLGCADRAPPVPPRDAGRLPIDAGPNLPLDAGTDPQGRPDGGPRLPPADLSVVLPYLGEPVAQDLEIEGEVGTLDVFFSIDTTGSFGGEIDNLQADLRSRILPELRERVADVAIGVGRFEDFPQTPFGEAGDRPFRLLAPITSDEARVGSAVAALDQPLGNGGDIPESSAEALYQIATGEGYPGLVSRYSGVAARGGGTLGGVGFREDALRVVVHVTDAPAHEPADYGSAFTGSRSLGQAIEALGALGVRALGIASGDAARAHLEALAIGTHALVDPVDGFCRTGVSGSARPPREGRCPLVFDVRPDGTGLADAIVDAIADLLSTVSYDEVWGETDDRLGFVRSIAALSAEPPAGTEAPLLADRRPPGDGVDDTFLDVRPGTVLRFRALLRNETIVPADYDQVFNLILRVVGDGVTLLSRRVRVTVPRGRLDGGSPRLDAGPIDAGPIDGARADGG